METLVFRFINAPTSVASLFKGIYSASPTRKHGGVTTLHRQTTGRQLAATGRQLAATGRQLAATGRQLAWQVVVQKIKRHKKGSQKVNIESSFSQKNGWGALRVPILGELALVRTVLRIAVS